MQEGRWMYLNFEKWLFWVVILTWIWPNSSPRLLAVQYVENKVRYMNWKLYYSRVHGQIHFAAQFTSGVLSHFQNALQKAGFLVLKGKKWDTPPPPVTPKLKVRELSQSEISEISHHTQLLCQVSAKSVDHNFWPLEHFFGQWHLNQQLEHPSPTQVLSTNFVPHTWGGFYFRLHPLFLKAGFHYRWSWCHNQKGRTLGSSEKGIPVPLTTPLLMIWWKVLCQRCKQ